MRNRIALLSLIAAAMALAVLCSKEEAPAPPLESLPGYWKWYNPSQHEGCGSEDYFGIYWFKEDGGYEYLGWSDSYGIIKTQDIHSGTWSLNGLQLTVVWEGHTDQVFELEYTSESVILTLISTIPSYTREYKYEPHPWIPIEYRSRFSLPAEDPS